jgi:Transposase DDE domain group 1
VLEGLRTRNLPFDGFCANEAWVAVSVIAGSLLAWSQMTGFDGALAKAEPKTMRYRVLHGVAVLAHRGHELILRLDQSWPWASELFTAFARLRTAFP